MKETIPSSSITWSEMGKQNIQAKEVYCHAIYRRTLLFVCNRPFRKILKYSLFVPPNFAQALFLFLFIGTIVSPKRNWKPCLFKIWGDKRRVLWYFPKWPIRLIYFCHERTTLTSETSIFIRFYFILCFLMLTGEVVGGEALKSNDPEFQPDSDHHHFIYSPTHFDTKRADIGRFER